MGTDTPWQGTLAGSKHISATSRFRDAAPAVFDTKVEQLSLGVSFISHLMDVQNPHVACQFTSHHLAPGSGNLRTEGFVVCFSLFKTE